MQKSECQDYYFLRIAPYMDYRAPYMDLPKRKQIMNAYFKSQFSYSPLTWVMHSRKLACIA